MKVVIAIKPSGLYGGEEWPEVGASIDLPAHVADPMIAAGLVVAAKPATKAPAKQEKRPASTDRVESRKKNA